MKKKMTIFFQKEDKRFYPFDTVLTFVEQKGDKIHTTYTNPITGSENMPHVVSSLTWNAIESV